MPLDFQPVPIPIQGLDGKTSPILRAPGVLDEAINVEMLKLGNAVALQKRPGYQRIDPTAVVNAPSTDIVFIGCSTLGDELVIFSYNFVIALGDREADLRGEDALVYRGPNNRGACRIFHVSTSRTSQQYAEEDPP